MNWDGLTLHHLTLAVEQGPPDSGHVLVGKRERSVFGAGVRQGSCVHLAELLEVTQCGGEVPVLACETQHTGGRV